MSQRAHHVARMHTMLLKLMADGVPSLQAVDVMLDAHDLVAARAPVQTISAEVSASSRIVRAVCRDMDVTTDELRSGSRHERVVHARWVAAALMRALPMPMSLPQIARAVGLGHHTTIWYGLREIRGHGELVARVGRLRGEMGDLFGGASGREEAA